MPMKEKARLVKQPRKLSHDRFFDRHEAVTGSRSHKAMDYSQPLRSLRQLYSTGLTKRVLLPANGKGKNRNARRRYYPRLVRIQQEMTWRHKTPSRINQPFP